VIRESNFVLIGSDVILEFITMGGIPQSTSGNSETILVDFITITHMVRGLFVPVSLRHLTVLFNGIHKPLTGSDRS